jgi:hypothetical protein
MMMQLRTTSRCPTGLHTMPGFFVDDPEFKNILAQPFAFRILASNALASRRVLQKALTVVDDRAAVELVVEKPVASLR